MIDQTRNVGCSRLQYQLLIRDTQKVFAVALAKHVIALFRLHRRAGLRNSQMGNFSTGEDEFDAGQRCVLSSPGFFNGAPFSYRNRTPHLYEILFCCMYVCMYGQTGHTSVRITRRVAFVYVNLLQEKLTHVGDLASTCNSLTIIRTGSYM